MWFVIPACHKSRVQCSAVQPCGPGGAGEDVRRQVGAPHVVPQLPPPAGLVPDRGRPLYSNTVAKLGLRLCTCRWFSVNCVGPACLSSLEPPQWPTSRCTSVRSSDQGHRAALCRRVRRPGAALLNLTLLPREPGPGLGRGAGPALSTN